MSFESTSISLRIKTIVLHLTRNLAITAVLKYFFICIFRNRAYRKVKGNAAPETTNGARQLRFSVVKD